MHGWFYVLFEAYCLVILAFHRDTDTLVGLPRPIHESVKTLKQVTRVGCQSLGIGSHQGKLNYQGTGRSSSTRHIQDLLHLPFRSFGQKGKTKSLSTNPVSYIQIDEKVFLSSSHSFSLFPFILLSSHSLLPFTSLSP